MVKRAVGYEERYSPPARTKKKFETTCSCKKSVKERTKKQKKQSSQMASYVERIIDFLERQAANPEIPKTLLEDIEWAIEIISTNQLYTGNLDLIPFETNRPEIAAWLDRINLKAIPQNEEEMEHRSNI